VRLVRRGTQCSVYLNDGERPIIEGDLPVSRPKGCKDVFIGGRCDNVANLEGRMAEAVIYGA
jgi:hypothetical protein